MSSHHVFVVTEILSQNTLRRVGPRSTDFAARETALNRPIGGGGGIGGADGGDGTVDGTVDPGGGGGGGGGGGTGGGGGPLSVEGGRNGNGGGGGGGAGIFAGEDRRSSRLSSTLGVVCTLTLSVTRSRFSARTVKSKK
jgi:hypothetical protein